jgi:carboxyl-terminal processing protease
VNREVVLIDSVLGEERRSDGSWDFHLSGDSRIGYLRVTTFGKHTASEMRKVLSGVSGKPWPYQALIVDLRGNAGELLDAAVEVCDLFLDKGVIVSISDRNGRVLNRYSAKQGDTVVPAAVPVVVLVDTLSASASEIVAACLQDQRRAVVAGSRTWGKGTVQNVYELEGGRSALKLTTAKYLRPSGKNIHRFSDATEGDIWGVLPEESLTVKLSDEETAKLVERRLKRDNAPLPSPKDAKREPAASSSSDAAKSDAANAELREDPQLRRAVEFLRKKLGSRS